MPAKSGTKEQTRAEVREPKQYCVIMHNDDFTTMDFVVEILMEIFHKDAASANAIMMKVHKGGSARVGVYPYDIAVTKVEAATTRARQEGFPFRMTVEEA